ncbi:MAG: hypothetical protein ACREVE_09775 [Gammaproteobacteria bacterium]
MSSRTQPIVPKGEPLRRAVKWLSEQHRYDPETLEEACRRFDLSPLDEEFIILHFSQRQEEGLAGPRR